MSDFDRKFKSQLSDADGVPDGFDARIQTALRSLPAREPAAAPWPAVRSVRRWALASLAAAAAVCLISGTALAVSPSLRQLIWGSFQPYVQDLASTPENTQVYDGVEARIVSALSDGYANVIQIELRDLEGDRVREAWERYCETGVNEFSDTVIFHSAVSEDDIRQRSLDTMDTPFSMGRGDVGFTARPMGFDEETGALALRAALFTAAPTDIQRQAKVEIDTGIVGTQAQTVRHESGANWTQQVLKDGVVVSEKSGIGYSWDVPVAGWTLTAPLAGLSARDVELDGVRLDAAEAYSRGDNDQKVSIDPTMLLTSVRISQMGVTVCREPDAQGDFRMAPDELTVLFRNGETQVISGGWENHLYTDFELNGCAVNADTWLFSEPTDPDSVTGIMLGGVEIPLS